MDAAALTREQVVALPKASLHLHLTGGARRETIRELAAERGRRLPDVFATDGRLALDTGSEKGWHRFQRLYDTARSVLTDEAAVRRVVTEIAEDEAASGAAWVELQVDPTTYAAHLGGLTPTVELLTDAVAAAAERAGIGMVLVVAANRTRHPEEAAMLARLAVRHADRGIVGFGLSNNERAPGAEAERFAKAFRIARAGGLMAVPHGGELAGPDSVRACLDTLGAGRIGHGVRATEDPRLLDELARRAVTLEVCPSSNLALGVVAAPDFPLRHLLDAGVPVALGSDDPLLFDADLADNYLLAAHLGATAADLAACAAASIAASAAPDSLKRSLLAGVQRWRRDITPAA